MQSRAGVTDDQSDVARWEERLEKHQKWIDQHEVKKILAGQKLDVLDTEHIWCQALVELKLQVSESEVPLLLIHYDGWSRKFDEFLS